MNTINNFTKEYKDSAERLYFMRYGKEMPLNLKEKVENLIQGSLDNPDTNNGLVIHNSHKGTVEELSMGELLHNVYGDKYVITGYGCLYERHENNFSALSRFLLAQLARRKTAKNDAFTHINDEDDSEYKRLNILQLLFKLIANAEYGASGEENYIMANPFIGPSTTYCGYAVITSSILYIEGLMENNLDFDGEIGIYRFIEECLLYNKKYPDEISEWLDDANLVTPDYLYNYLIGKSSVIIEESLDLRAMCKNMSQEVRNRIFYTNNLSTFLDQYRVQEVLSKCYSYEFTDPNKAPADIAEYMNKFNWLVRSFVAHPFINYNRPYIAKTMQRKNILLVDSDSLFTYLGRFVKKFEEMFEGLDIKCIKHKIATAHIANNMIGNLLQDILDAVTSGSGIPEKYQSRINMKSEFLFQRIAMTNNKKNYSSLTLVNEGVMLDPPRFTIKGLPIKKVSTNIKTRDYFSELLLNDILLPENIDPKKILRKFVEYEEDVFSTITDKRTTEYLIPGKFSTIPAYKNPYSNYICKGVALWNYLNPDNVIQPYSKVNMLKLKLVNSIIDVEFLKDTFRDIYNNFITALEDKDYFSRGINAVALPKNIKEIPKYLIPLIDTNTIVTSNTAAAYPIMESIGFQLIPSSGSSKQITTFISI